MRSAAFFIVLTLLLLPDPGSGGIALAQEDKPSRYTGRLTTVLEAYQNAFGNTSTPVYEYLNLTVFDPYGIGDRSYFHFYGRLADDLSGEDDTVDSRLYSAYLDVQELFKSTDARLGRQFLYTTAGTALMDGADIRFKGIGDMVDFRLYGGGDVKFVEDYDEGDAVYGMALDLVGLKSFNAGISYLRKLSGWDLVRESAGADINYHLRDVARFYVDGRYDMMAKSMQQYNVGARFFIGNATTVTADYAYNLPVFDADDIYSVFAVAEYTEARLALEHRFSRWVTVYGSFSREMYDEGDDNNVVEAGALMRRNGNLSAYSSVIYISGEDDMLGGNLGGRYYLSDKTEIGLGVAYDKYERYDMTNSEEASLYYAEGKYYFNDSLYGVARVETRRSERSDDEVLGLFKVSYAFRSGVSGVSKQ